MESPTPSVPLKPTIEHLLEMDLETLEKMSDVEIQTYMEEALKICPPVKHSSIATADGETVRLKSSGGNKMMPKSNLGQQLSGTDLKRQQLERLAAQMGFNLPKKP